MFKVSIIWLCSNDFGRTLNVVGFWSNNREIRLKHYIQTKRNKQKYDCQYDEKDDFLELLKDQELF